MNTIIGIDGNKKGYSLCIIRGKKLEITDIPSLIFLESKIEKDSLILIDMPLGFPSSEEKRRSCDTELRKLLKGRASTVFNPPIEECISAQSYAEARSKAESLKSLKPSVQAWNLKEKMLELKHFSKALKAKIKVYESHPELAFKILNSKGEVLASKHSHDGRQNRIEIIENLLKKSSRIKAKDLSQDQLDACALAFMAHEKKTIKILGPQTLKQSSYKQIVYFE